MRFYQNYMDHQYPSPQLREALRLATAKPVRAPLSLLPLAAAAAAVALALGLGLLLPRQGTPITADATPAPVLTAPPVSTAAPAVPDVDQPISLEGDRYAFVPQGPALEKGQYDFPCIFTVNFADATSSPQVDALVITPPGAFSDPLVKEPILNIFWGPDGVPQDRDPQSSTGDFPLFLMDWSDYLIYGDATYAGDGTLWQIHLWGVADGRRTFSLLLAPGHIPPTCPVESDAVITDVLDVPVSGWYRQATQDGVPVYAVTSQFMAGDVGVCFTCEAPELEDAIAFNTMLPNHALREDGCLYLDHLAFNPNIPEWGEARYTSFRETLAGAEDFTRSHPGRDFAPYLPAQAPQGFGEFEGSLLYQENTRCDLSLSWYRGYDQVSILIRLPRTVPIPAQQVEPVDITVPESYDWRLYHGAISDVVPPQYQLNFYQPVFYAEDMSPQVIAARSHTQDTGGESYRFCVLHPDGTLVRYAFSGVDAQYVWSVVEPTL